MSPQASICTADLHEGFALFVFVLERKEAGNPSRGPGEGLEEDTSTAWETGGVWSLI